MANSSGKNGALSGRQEGGSQRGRYGTEEYVTILSRWGKTCSIFAKEKKGRKLNGKGKANRPGGGKGYKEGTEWGKIGRAETAQ